MKDFDASRTRRSRLALFVCGWFIVSVLATLPLAAMATNTTASMLSFAEDTDIPPSRAIPESTRILDARGRFVAMLHGEVNRQIIPLEKIPERVRQAVIAVEDESFYKHRGIDLQAIARSFLSNISAGEIRQGGSTITQQYVRNAYQGIGTERTLGRKIREAVLALRVEEEVSKNEILHEYLNAVYFGRGAYGIEAASKAFFGKSTGSLTLPEAATLAGVIRGPQLYGNPKDMKNRRDYVLRRMRESGFIDVKTEKAAIATPLRIRKNTPPPTTAAYFVEHVRRVMTDPVSEGGFGLSHAQVLGGGLTVYTTLDLDMQRTAERAVADVLYAPGDPESGFVVMTTSGEVRAIVGGRNYTSLERARGFNYATQQVAGRGRPVGSTFKTFTLAAYLDAGLSPGQTFAGPSRMTIKGCGSERDPWSPANYANQGFGSLSVIEATQKSVNTVYAQMVAKIGPAKAMRMAQLAGITSPMLPVCSITLGVFGVTPLEMARAYSTFATRGARPEVITVRKIVGPDGKVIAERKPALTQVIRRETADKVNAILQTVVTSGTGRPARTVRTSAGKTGTTDDFRDVWYVGYTPHPGLTGAVWIGYPPDKNGKIRQLTNVHGRRATGGGLAGAIWKRFMDKALARAGNPSFVNVRFSPPPKPKAKPKEAAGDTPPRRRGTYAARNVYVIPPEDG